MDFWPSVCARSCVHWKNRK